MPYLLHINVSPRGDDSYSTKLANKFIEAFKEKNPDTPIKVRDLATHAPPHLGIDGLVASWIPAEARNETQIAAYKIRTDAIDELTGFVWL